MQDRERFTKEQIITAVLKATAFMDAWPPGQQESAAKSAREMCLQAVRDLGSEDGEMNREPREGRTETHSG